MNIKRGLLIVLVCGGAAAAGYTASILSGNMANVAKADAAPFVTLDTFSGLPGSSVNVSGGNFTPGETVNIYEGSISNPPVASSTARGDSLFGPVSITIPANAIQGPLAIAAVGASSSLSDANSYYVDGLSPLLTVTSTSDLPGQNIRVDGTGFAAGETVNVFFGDASSTASASTSIAANSSGTFSSAILTIPYLSAGNHMITGRGEASGASTTAYFYIGGFYPTVTPSVYFAMPGNDITFDGSGFAPNENVNVFEDANTSSSLSISTNGSGAFTDAGPITVPFGLTGTSTSFMFVGASSTATTSATVSLGTLYPTLTPSAYFLQRGNSFTITADGFAGNESILVTPYGITPETVTANASGTALAGPFTVPLSASSTLIINATGGSSGATTSSSIQIGDAVARTLSSSTLNVALVIDNTAGGNATSSDFVVSIAGANADPASFTGSATTTAITVTGDTGFSVDATVAPSSTAVNYITSLSGNCIGQIPSGMSDTCTVTETYTVPPPTIDLTPTSLPDATMGANYSQTLTASTTATSSFNWSVATGTLPDGLTLDASSSAATAIISGIPTATGGSTFTIEVTNGSSTTQQVYTLTVDAAPTSNTGTLLGSSGGGGGGGGYYIPLATPNTSGTTTNNGVVLGVSTVNVNALLAELASLKQQLFMDEMSAMPSCTAIFTRTLKIGSQGTDVRNLQKLLNASVLTQITVSGMGAPGNETIYFGPATAKAVMAFQELFADSILAPSGLTKGTGVVGAATRAKLNALCKGNL